MGKIKSYKKQIEEAEEIAALNLAKFRKVQGNLTESEARADLNEQALAKSRARDGVYLLVPNKRFSYACNCTKQCIKQSCYQQSCLIEIRFLNTSLIRINDA